MKPNLQYEQCAKCGTEKGTEPIFDEYGNNYWICEYCESDLFEVTTRVEGLKDE